MSSKSKKSTVFVELTHILPERVNTNDSVHSYEAPVTDEKKDQ
jgi:hypothetical protein